jgi:transcriptional regulator with XRE-family HTH domain
VTSAFSQELERLLANRDLSWRKLAKLTGYTAGWLSKVKNGAPPSADLARHCDEVLEADGEWRGLLGDRHEPQPVVWLRCPGELRPSPIGAVEH